MNTTYKTFIPIYLIKFVCLYFHFEPDGAHVCVWMSGGFEASLSKTKTNKKKSFNMFFPYISFYQSYF